MLKVESLEKMARYKISEENSRKMNIQIQNDGDEEEILEPGEGMLNPQRRTMNSLPEEKIVLDKETQTD